MKNRKMKWDWCQSCNYSPAIDRPHPDREEKCKGCTKKVGDKPSNYEYFRWP